MQKKLYFSTTPHRPLPGSGSSALCFTLYDGPKLHSINKGDDAMAGNIDNDDQHEDSPNLQVSPLPGGGLWEDRALLLDQAVYQEVEED